jgi:hypothetical protein
MPEAKHSWDGLLVLAKLKHVQGIVTLFTGFVLYFAQALYLQPLEAGLPKSVTMSAAREFCCLECVEQDKVMSYKLGCLCCYFTPATRHRQGRENGISMC